MSQTNWERRVLLVLDREEELEPKNALSKETSDYIKSISGLTDQGLVSRSEAMRLLYGVTSKELAEDIANAPAVQRVADLKESFQSATGAAAAFAASLAGIQNIPPEDLRRLGINDPGIQPQNFASDTLLLPYSPKEAEVMRSFYENTVGEPDLKVETLKMRRPVRNIQFKFKMDVDFEKMERNILDLDDKDDE